MNKTKKQRLNMFLLKEGTTLNDCMSKEIKGIREHALDTSLPFSGRLYTQSSAANAPAWVAFLKKGTSATLGNLSSQNASALLAIEVSNRVFCFVFGFARHWVADGLMERRFGMLTTLNCVDHDALKAIDKEEFEAVSRTTRSQVSSSSSIGVFGIDPQRDLIRSVAGKPQDKRFADYIAGADSLVLTTPVTFESLGNKANEVLNYFESKEYQKTYPWIDNFQRIKSKERIAELDVWLVKNVLQMIMKTRSCHLPAL